LVENAWENKFDPDNKETFHQDDNYKNVGKIIGSIDPNVSEMELHCDDSYCL